MLRNEEEHNEELIQVETQPKKNSWKNNFVALCVAFVIINDILLLPALGGCIIYACATMREPPGYEFETEPYCHCCHRDACVVDHDYPDAPAFWTFAWAIAEGFLFLPTLQLIVFGIFEFLRILFMVPHSTMWKPGFGYAKAVGSYIGLRQFGQFYFTTMVFRLIFVICACIFLHLYPTCNLTCGFDCKLELDWDWNGRINMLRMLFGFYIFLAVIQLTARRIFVYFLLPLVEREVSSVTILRLYFVKTEEAPTLTATIVRNSD